MFALILSREDQGTSKLILGPIHLRQKELRSFWYLGVKVENECTVKPRRFLLRYHGVYVCVVVTSNVGGFLLSRVTRDGGPLKLIYTQPRIGIISAALLDYPQSHLIAIRHALQSPQFLIRERRF